MAAYRSCDNAMICGTRCGAESRLERHWLCITRSRSTRSSPACASECTWRGFDTMWFQTERPKLASISIVRAMASLADYRCGSRMKSRIQILGGIIGTTKSISFGVHSLAKRAYVRCQSRILLLSVVVVLLFAGMVFCLCLFSVYGVVNASKST